MRGDIPVITALSEYVDVLYTKADTMLPRGMWWGIEVSQKRAGQKVSPRVCIKVMQHDRTYKTDAPFSAVEEGYRVGPEELATVAEYHIKRIMLSIEKGYVDVQQSA
jgi:hypothetical protein